MGMKPRCLVRPDSTVAELAAGRHVLTLCLRPQVGARVFETQDGTIIFDTTLAYKDAYEVYQKRRAVLLRSVGR